MKKILTVLLVFVMCLSLFACGNSTNIEDLAGTWNSSIKDVEHSLVINSNSTYEHGDDKGTITISKDGFSLEEKNGSKTNFQVYGNYIYNETCCFEKDDEYGLTFSPDENGKTDQSFAANASGFSFTKKTGYSHFSIDFNKDGTCVLSLGWFGTSYFDGRKVDKTIEGTYSYSDNIITLTDGADEYKMIVDDNKIYYLVYEK